MLHRSSSHIAMLEGMTDAQSECHPWSILDRLRSETVSVANEQKTECESNDPHLHLTGVHLQEAALR